MQGINLLPVDPDQLTQQLPFIGLVFMVAHKQKE